MKGREVVDCGGGRKEARGMGRFVRRAVRSGTSEYLKPWKERIDRNAVLHLLINPMSL